MMHAKDLIRMANQIAAHFACFPRDEAVTETIGHIRDFWEPRMRRALLDHIDAGGHGLHELVLHGAEALRAEA
ncbi:formate dehydrogenase subunit delta [Azospirillum halopraeferens]|uniref:formate dehydrogenase subunit delta n=1 Tax=Azospirillum halopraeferens TaxID=34010 RepID=UPI001B3BD3EA|nr:formate dehydrogenase subunit delta [Azospirillum halopraeferens]